MVTIMKILIDTEVSSSYVMKEIEVSAWSVSLETAVFAMVDVSAKPSLPETYVEA
jgi:hypothetical protein